MDTNIKNLDIIYFTLFPWDNAYSSVSLSFTREFSKNTRVFYINRPYSLKDVIRNRKDKMLKKRLKGLLKNKKQYEQINELPSNVIAVHPPLTFPINWLSKGKLYDFFSKINNKIVLKTIKEVIKDYELKDYIYLNCYNPYSAGILPKDFNTKLNIYQCIDDYEYEPYIARHGARLEREVIKNADVVFVTSTKLLELKKVINPNTYLLPNAVDLSIFSKTIEEKFPKPKEIKDISTPIIGFTGNMDPVRIDFPLLKKVAEAHPDKTLVLVGPVNSSEIEKIGLDKLKNVIFTGQKHIRELPNYLQHFDCTLIPFKLNELTESIYPLKINEYLGAGTAVVSTSFSKDIRGFSDVIYLAKDENDFLKLIDIAIDENSESKINERVQKAKKNTWTERVKQFWEVTNKNLINN